MILGKMSIELMFFDGDGRVNEMIAHYNWGANKPSHRRRFARREK